MKKALHFSLLIMCGYCGVIFCSPALDRSFGLRSIVAVVINGDKEPVYSEHIENQILKYLKSDTRFDFANEPYIWLKSELSKLYLYDPSVSTKDKIYWIQDQINKLAGKGVDSLIVAEVIRYGERYKISFVLMSVDGAYSRTKDVEVADSTSLDNFTDAVVHALDELVSQIPFDATVIRRVKYRVVIDRTAPYMSKGMLVRAYTVEANDNKFFLKETGLLEVTEVGDSYSFADIKVENRPLEVTEGNKVLFGQAPRVKRDPAFEDLTVRYSNRQLGLIDLHLGITSVMLSNRAVNGTGLTDSHVYTGGAVHGELWLTAHTFLDLGVRYGMATVPATSLGQQTKLSSNVSDFRTQIGYRFGIGYPRTGLTVSTRAGFAMHRIQVGVTSDPLAFQTNSFIGPTVGAGVTFPISRKFGLGFDVDSILFPSFSENPLESGDHVSSLSAWQYCLRGYYNLDENIDLLASLGFDSYMAEFSGQGTRPVPLSSASTSGYSLRAGVAYYF